MEIYVMKIIPITTISIIALLSGCATDQGPVNTSDDSSIKNIPLTACATNFKTEGSLLTGTKFSSFQEFQKTTVPGAFDNLLSAVATSGYQIVSSSKETGLISANQTVSFGKGKTVPLNIFVKKINPSGIRVEIVTNLSGGVGASSESVRNEFCKLLATVDQSSNAAELVAAQEPTDTPKKKKNTKKK